MDPDNTLSLHTGVLRSAHERSDLMMTLSQVASEVANEQLVPFSLRLIDALASLSKFCDDPIIASQSLDASNLLRDNGYAFYYLSSEILEKLVQVEVESVNRAITQGFVQLGEPSKTDPSAAGENSALLTELSQAIEASNREALKALNIRLACLTGSKQLKTNQNPFRPEVFLVAIHRAWCEFDPNPESHHLLLPLMLPEIFMDLSPVFLALDNKLIEANIPLDSAESNVLARADNNSRHSEPVDSEQTKLSQQLTRFFSVPPGNSGDKTSFTKNLDCVSSPAGLTAAKDNSKLLNEYLDIIQKGELKRDRAGTSGIPSNHHEFLPQLKAKAPAGLFSRADENTIDLLTSIFQAVYQDQDIPRQVKELVGFLQVPVLKAALVDMDFFFEETHPARRLIELLGTSGKDWSQDKEDDLPLFLAMKRSVDQVQQKFDGRNQAFEEALSELEAFVNVAENKAALALSIPISKAIKNEKIIQATRSAKSEVAARIGTGEVVAFVETFLENKWVPVLTIAYSVKEEKPHILKSAIKTMDDLVWSVKPKITLEQRKELISKLPSLLATLNKWIDMVKWDDAERLKFFADLAECHASIVRAPLDLTPERHLQIAVQVAQQATEDRIAKRSNAESVGAADDYEVAVTGLRRGMWLEFTEKDAVSKKVRLSWISPLRSLYIFTANGRQEAFSLSAEDLIQAFRDGRVKAQSTEGLVDRALSQALKNAALNDTIASRPAIA